MIQTKYNKMIYFKALFFYAFISLTTGNLHCGEADSAASGDPTKSSPILTHPEHKEELSKPRDFVTDFTNSEFLKEVKILVKAFKHLPGGRGAGLAATQLGLKYNIIILSPDRDVNNYWVLVNPELNTAPGTEYFDTEEGCFSCPRTIAKRTCPRKGILGFYTLAGDYIRTEVENLYLLTVLNHEIRHNRGKLIINDISTDSWTTYDGSSEASYKEVIDGIRRKDAETGHSGIPAKEVILRICSSQLNLLGLNIVNLARPGS
jgi:peptide deformylase